MENTKIRGISEIRSFNTIYGVEECVVKQHDSYDV